jgi:hypothetical protein
MPSLRPKPESEPAIEVEERVLCIEGFRPGAVAALIEGGRYLPRNHRAVIAFPENFRALVRLEQLDDPAA